MQYSVCWINMRLNHNVREEIPTMNSDRLSKRSYRGLRIQKFRRNNPIASWWCWFVLSSAFFCAALWWRDSWIWSVVVSTIRGKYRTLRWALLFFCAESACSSCLPQAVEQAKRSVLTLQSAPIGTLSFSMFWFIFYLLVNRPIRKKLIQFLLLHSTQARNDQTFLLKAATKSRRRSIKQSPLPFCWQGHSIYPSFEHSVARKLPRSSPIPRKQNSSDCSSFSTVFQDGEGLAFNGSRGVTRTSPTRTATSALTCHAARHQRRFSAVGRGPLRAEGWLLRLFIARGIAGPLKGKPASLVGMADFSLAFCLIKFQSRLLVTCDPFSHLLFYHYHHPFFSIFSELTCNLPPHRFSSKS